MIITISDSVGPTQSSVSSLQFRNWCLELASGWKNKNWSYHFERARKTVDIFRLWTNYLKFTRIGASVCTLSNKPSAAHFAYHHKESMKRLTLLSFQKVYIKTASYFLTIEAFWMAAGEIKIAEIVARFSSRYWFCWLSINLW